MHKRGEVFQLVSFSLFCAKGLIIIIEVIF